MATIHVNEDGSIALATGSMDVGGSRASMAMMAAQTLGVPCESVRFTVADAAFIGYNHVTGGSRVTYATGMAVVQACQKIIDDMRARAAIIWDVDVEGVIWENGAARPAHSDVGAFSAVSAEGYCCQARCDGWPNSGRSGGQCRWSGTRGFDSVL